MSTSLRGYDNAEPLPIEGPIGAERYFATQPVVPGTRPVRRLAIGTAFMVGLEPEGPVATMHRAWTDGFEYVDTAPMYGDAEELVSLALASWTGERPVVATKTKQTDSADLVRQRWIRSLGLLGKVDLLAVHDATLDYSPESRERIGKFIRERLDTGDIAAAGLGGGGPVVQAQWLAQGIFRYCIVHQRVDAVTLQGLRDSVPQAKLAGAAVVAASPMHRGVLDTRHSRLVAYPPAWLDPVFIRRSQQVKSLAEASGLPLTHLALRFALSIPSVDLVLTGAKSIAEWEDCRAAYESGPLPQDLYAAVWQIAQDGAEPEVGG